MPGWDNEARQPGKGHIYAHSSPEAYAEWLDQACLAATSAPRSRRLVFVNAWNEWGEGAYLEPDRTYGYAYLHATTNVLRGYVQSGNAAELAAESRHAFRKKSNVAVVLHLYYEDLLDDLADSFLINVQTSDLFVTVRPDVSEETIRDLLKRFPNAYVSIGRNRGRDILPFLSMIALASTLGYEVACKLHTKKSTHRSDGTSLRTRLVGELIGTRERVDRILSSFRADPNLGMVVPHGSRLSLVEECFNIYNRQWLNEMLPRLGRSKEIDLYRFHFPAGSMFWFRPAALNPLMRLSLQPDHFERELGQLDGTLAHTIERLFELSAEVAGYRVTDTQSLYAPCEAPNMVLGA